MRTKLKALLITGSTLAVICVPLMVGAGYTPQEVVYDPGGGVGKNTGLGNADVISVVGGVINWLLGLLALIALVLVLYAGILWMFSRGNEDQIQSAKDILQGTLFGLVIILASYGITQYVFENLINATYNGPS